MNWSFLESAIDPKMNPIHSITKDLISAYYSDWGREAIILIMAGMIVS